MTDVVAWSSDTAELVLGAIASTGWDMDSEGVLDRLFSIPSCME